MKWLGWALAAAVAAALGMALLINQDDLRRYERMRRMCGSLSGGDS